MKVVVQVFNLVLMLLLVSCGGGSDTETDNEGVSCTPPQVVNAAGTGCEDPAPVAEKSNIDITAASGTVTVAEQTDYSIRADIVATNESGAGLPVNVSWSIADAPDGFAMDINGGEVDADNKSIISFTTPNVEQDTEITVQLDVTVDATDTVEASSESVQIPVLIEANQSVVISGAVVDDFIPFAEVTIKIGEQIYTVTADAQGFYQIPVEFIDPTLVVEVTAKGTSEEYAAVEFKSYLGSGETLVEAAGEDGTLTADENININVSNVTTAVYVLVQDILEGQDDSEGTPPEEVVLDQSELNELIEQVDTEEVIEVAAVIQLVVDYGADLPEGTETVLELVIVLVDDEAATEEFIDDSIEQIAEENPDLEPISLDDLIEDIVQDENLVPSAEEDQFAGTYIVANTVKNVSSDFGRDDLLFGVLSLTANNSGSVDNFMMVGDQDLTWEISGTQVVAEFAEVAVVPNEYYGLPANLSLALNGFTINELSSTDENRSWYIRLVGDITDSNDNSVTSFETDSISVTSIPAAQLISYTSEELVGNSAYLTVVDEMSVLLDDSALLNANNDELSFAEDNQGSYTNSAGTSVAFSWDIDSLGILTLDLDTTTVQQISYARVKSVTDSIAFNQLTSVEYDGSGLAFSDLTLIKPSAPALTDFQLVARFNIAGTDQTLTFLDDDTGFLFDPNVEKPFQHFAYSGQDNAPLIEFTKEGTRRCALGLETCSAESTQLMSFQHFDNATATVSVSEQQADTQATEGRLALLKQIRDESLTVDDIPTNLNLFNAADESTMSLYFNDDGSGSVNFGSAEGVCTDITWQVNDEGRLQITESSLETTYRLLAGNVNNGVFSAQSGDSTQVLSTSSSVLSCAQVTEQFIALTEVEAGNFEVVNLDDGEISVLRFNDDNTGYIVLSDDYYTDGTIRIERDDITWSINDDGKLEVIESEVGLPSLITLTEGSLNNGTIKVSLDDDENGDYEKTLLMEIFAIRECTDFDLDGIGDCTDLDDDNDGVNDADDPWPNDPTRSIDTDGDGIDNILDEDDDDDGIPDVIDPNPLVKDVIAGGDFGEGGPLSETNLSSEYLRINKGLLANPAVRMGIGNGARYYFDKDQNVRQTIGGTGYTTSESYQIVNGVLVINYVTPNTFTDYIDVYRLAELDIISIEDAEQFESQYGYTQLAVEVKEYSQRWSLIEDTDTVDTFWSMSVQSYRLDNEWEAEQVNNDGSEILIPLEGVAIALTQVDSVNYIPFTTEMVTDKSWNLSVNIDNQKEIAQGEYNFSADLVTFNADGTASTRLSEESLTWSIVEGTLEITNSTKQTSQEFNIYSEFDTGYGVVMSGTASNAANGDSYQFADFELAVVFDPSATITPLIDNFAQNAFSLTNPAVINEQGHLAPEGVFGFKLNTDGTGKNIINGQFDLNKNNEGWRIRHWSTLDNSNEVAIVATNKQYDDGTVSTYVSCDVSQSYCKGHRERHWLPLATVGNRVYLLEWELWNNTGQDFEAEDDWYNNIPARVNFYEVYDLENGLDLDGDGISNELDWDVDGDGVANEDDLSPLDANIMFDTDGDGIADSLDDDDDNDGVLDVNDFAPLEPLVSSITPITIDNLSNKYLGKNEGALDEPEFSVGNVGGDVLTFNLANNEYTYSELNDYEVGSTVINEDGSLSLQSDFGVDRYDIYLWELVEIGAVDHQTAQDYEDADKPVWIPIEESIVSIKIWLAEQNGDIDTFYIEELEEITFVNDWQRGYLTGDVNSDPVQVEDNDVVQFTRLAETPSLSFSESELIDNSWSLPVNRDGRDRDFYGPIDDLVTFNSDGSAESLVHGLQFDWQINNNKLELYKFDGDVVTISKQQAYDGAYAVLSEFETQLASEVEGVWPAEGIDGVSMPTPDYIGSATEAVIYYNRRNGDLTDWTLHTWSTELCPGVSNTDWYDGLQPTGFDANYGAYWVVDISGADNCVNFIPHSINEGKQTNDLKAMLADSENNTFFVMSLDDYDDRNTTEVYPYPRTYESLDVFEYTPAILSGYQLAAQQDSSLTFSNFENSFVAASFGLTDPDSYDEDGVLKLECDDCYGLYGHMYNADGTMARIFGEFDLDNIPTYNHWNWVFDAAAGEVVMQRLRDNVTGEYVTECNENNGCTVTRDRHWKLLSANDTRVYVLEWETDPYDENNPAQIGPRIQFYEKYDLSIHDLDNDGISDGIDGDVDGDGEYNEDDVYPYDGTEWQDTDGDGIGDNADTDADDDGIDDEFDAAPLDPNVGELIEVTLENLANKYIEISQGRLLNPDFDMSEDEQGGLVLFNQDTTFSYVDNEGSTQGSWQLENGKVKIVEIETEIIDIYQLLYDDLIDQDTITAYIEVYQDAEFEVVYTNTAYLAMISDSTEKDVFMGQSTEVVSVADPELHEFLFGSSDEPLVSDEESFQITLYDYQEVTKFEYRGSEISGQTIAMHGLPKDEDSDNEVDFLIADLITFNADGTGNSYTGLSADFTWLVNVDGELELTFTDIGTLTQTKLNVYDDSFGVHSIADYNGQIYSQYGLSLTKEDDASFDVLNDKVSLWSGLLTNPENYQYGLYLPENYQAMRLSFTENILTTINEKSYDVADVNSDKVWRSNIVGDSSDFLTYPEISVDGDGNWGCNTLEQGCIPFFRGRDIALKTVGNRVYTMYIFEQNDAAWSGGEEWRIEQTGVSFTEVSNIGADFDHDGIDDNVDTDIDNDGVANDVDSHPSNPYLGSDIDGDGVDDNLDSDIDGDMVANEFDAYPEDPSKISEVVASAAFTSDLLLNKTFVAVAEVKDGWLARNGDAYEFNDNSATLYEHNGDRVTASIKEWAIVGEHLNFGASQNSTTSYYYPFDDLYDLGFNEEQINELKYAWESGIFSNDIEVVGHTLNSTWTIVAQDDAQKSVQIETHSTFEINRPDNGWSWQTPSQSSVEFTSYQISLRDHEYSIFDSSILADVEGKWVLPHSYELDNSTAFNEGYNFLADVITLSGTNGSSQLSIEEFQVSTTSDALVLTSGEVEYSYRAQLQQENLYLASIEKTVSGDREFVTSQQIARFDNNQANLIDNISGELPKYVSAHVNSHLLSGYENGELVPQQIWGYNFAPDNSLTRTGAKVLDSGFTVYNFTRDWTWESNESQVIHHYLKDENTQDERIRRRTWDVVSVGQNGFSVILEYSKYGLDWDSDGVVTDQERGVWFIVPRLNLVKVDDLTNRDDVWYNTEQLGLASEADLDNDGILDRDDNDDDGDGIDDIIELKEGSNAQDSNDKPIDTDNDGYIDYFEYNAETDPTDASSIPADNDGDFIPDYYDNDDDNDGIPDDEDNAQFVADAKLSELTFTDSAIVSCLNNWYVNDPYVFEIDTLNCDGSYVITDLTGIEQLFNLHSVELDTNEISDYSVIASVPNLGSFLSSDPLFDNSHLSQVAANLELTNINLGSSLITDIESLRDHPNLYSLHILPSSSSLNTSIFLTMPNLRELAISASSVDNYSEFSGLSNLGSLWLHGDVDELMAVEVAQLTSLVSLSIGYSSTINDTVLATILSGTTLLEELEVADTAVTDISPAFTLPSLQNFTFKGDAIADESQITQLEAQGVIVNYTPNVP